VSALRDGGALVAAAGVLALLLPLPGIRRTEAVRAAGLVALVLGGAMVLASLVPGDDARNALESLGSPARAVAAVVAVLLAIAVLVVAVRVVVARPTAWFVLLAIAMPIRLPITVGSLEANLLVPLYAVIALGVVAWIWARLRGRVPAANPGPTVLNVPLAAFTAFLLVSVLWTTDGDEAGIKTACFYVPFVIVYALVLAWWPHARALAALTLVTLAGGVVAALMALWQFQTGELWWNETLQQANVYSQFFRVNGFFFDPNILGRYLAIGIIGALAVAWTRRRGWELAVLAGAAAIMAAGLFVTYSRSSTLMLMIGIALLAGRAVGARRAFATAAVLLVVIGGITFAASSNVRHAATSTERLERVSEGRFDLMRGGLTIWREAPVTGTGLGSFAQEFEETLTEAERAKIRVVISHNTPITVLSEGGIVGFALFLALIAGAGWATVVGSRRQGGIEGWARWTLGAILLGILVHSLLYAALFEDPFVWAAAAAAVALAAVAPARGTDDNRDEPDTETGTDSPEVAVT